MSVILSLEDLLHDELRALYDAETRLTKAIPKMVKKATDENLRAALKAHLAETKTHLERLERAFDFLEEHASAKTCAGIKGIIAEGNEHMSEEYETDQLRDLVIVGVAQRVEHYEIAAYSNAVAHAKAQGMADLASLLAESLYEEKAAELKLSEMCGPLAAAAHAIDQTVDDDEDEDDEDDDEKGKKDKKDKD